jgi:hypothetical protein
VVILVEEVVVVEVVEVFEVEVVAAEVEEEEVVDLIANLKVHLIVLLVKNRFLFFLEIKILLINRNWIVFSSM